MIIIVLIAFIIFNSASATPNAPRIINGVPVNLNTSPRITWHVSVTGVDLTTGRGFSCGGSILDKRHILTAGHCVRVLRSDGTQMDYPIRFFRVKTGTTITPNPPSEGSELFDVEQIYVHPLWKGGTAFGDAVDMAIMRLGGDITFSQFVQPIALAESGCTFCQTVGAQYIVSGYGHTMPGAVDSTGRSLNLLYTRQRYAPAVECLTSIPIIPFNDFCAKAPAGENGAICKGDSGGPLVIETGPSSFVQVGVVSARVQRVGEPVCGSSNEVGLYESVSNQREGFIDPVLRGEMPGMFITTPPAMPLPHSGSAGSVLRVGVVPLGLAILGAIILM